MSRKFTPRFQTTNRGGVHAPHHLSFGSWWRILMLDADGTTSIVEIHLLSDSCPARWLEERGMVLGDDALVEFIR